MAKETNTLNKAAGKLESAADKIINAGPILKQESPLPKAPDAPPRKPRIGDTVYFVATGVGEDGKTPKPTRFSTTNPGQPLRPAIILDESQFVPGLLTLAVWNGIGFEPMAKVRYDGSEKPASLTWHFRD